MLLDAYEKELSMIVEDNGRGFFPIKLMWSDSPSRRLGLLGVSRRLTLVLALCQDCALDMGAAL